MRFYVNNEHAREFKSLHLVNCGYRYRVRTLDKVVRGYVVPRVRCVLQEIKHLRKSLMRINTQIDGFYIEDHSTK